MVSSQPSLAVPAGVLPSARRPGFRGFSLVWLSALYLNAPLVAIIWLYFLGQVLRVEVTMSEAILVGLAAWLAYAGDRWLDSFTVNPAQPLSPQHFFAVRRRKLLGCFWLVGAGLGAWISTHSLSRSAFWGGAGLLAVVAVYYLLTFIWPEGSRTFAPRELMVAVLFSAGSSLFVLIPAEHFSAQSLVAASWFALLCFLNCLGVACWEKPRNRRQGQVSLATRWPGLASAFPAIAAGIAGVSVAMIFIGPFHLLFPIKAAASISALLLASLHFAEPFISLDVRLVLADLALLTPVAFFFVR